MVASSLPTLFQTVSYSIGLVSAFAVRRSARAFPMAETEPLAEAVGRNTVDRRQMTSPERDRWRSSPAKRRKTNGEAGYWATQKASNSGTAKISPPLARPKIAEAHLDSESDELDSGEEIEGYRAWLVLNHCAQHMVLNTFCSHDANKLPHLSGTSIKQLSTFVPNDQNVVGELAGIWTIRLGFKDVCTWRLSTTLMGT